MNEMDIYSQFIGDELFSTVPFLDIREEDSDIYIQWSYGSRLDKLSAKYYGNPTIYKLILLANPSYVCEGDINIDDYIRIPFPKESFFNRISESIQKNKLF